MTEAERFAVVLDELGALLNRLDGLCEVVLIGGQVLAVEQVAASQDPVPEVETATGQRVIRGYSFDPDLLIESLDPEESARWDELPHLLREAGYRRGGRAFQWEKQVGEVYVRLDLFTPEGGPLPPTEMTPLPRGEAVLKRAIALRLRLGTREVRIRTPSIVDFVLMKLDATRIRRPPNAKDAFDLYAYVRRKTPKIVGAALAREPERDEALARLHELFGTDDAPGVTDVLAFAPTLAGIDRALVVRDVVRTFADLERAAGG
jgi:hypothetical protein